MGEKRWVTPAFVLLKSQRKIRVWDLRREVDQFSLDSEIVELQQWLGKTVLLVLRQRRANTRRGKRRIWCRWKGWEENTLENWVGKEKRGGCRVALDSEVSPRRRIVSE